MHLQDAPKWMSQHSGAEAQAKDSFFCQSGQRQPAKLNSSRKELIKELQFPPTQTLVLCEHNSKPKHSHC